MSKLTAPPQRAETLQQDGGRLRPVVAGIGAFLVVAGLFLRFYAAPRLVAAPTSLYQTDTLVAHGASYFNEGTLTTQSGATLTYTVTIRGDPAASNGQTAVWDEFDSLADPEHQVIVQSTYQRAAFNRRTGALSSCCGAALNDDTRNRPTGIGLFWPIGTAKTTYQVFDTNTGRSWPATYAGQARDEGVLTYRFVQHIPATLVQQMPGVPDSLLGLHGSGNVVANRYYQADVTYWVDPRTGVLVDQQERGLSVLRGPTGQGQLTVAHFDLRMTAASRRALAAEASRNAAQIAMVRLTGPLGGVVLGLILLLLSLVIRRKRPASRES